jgi:acyl-homoserine lactone acylase PvdQ
MTRVMNRLAAWDCRMDASSIEASLYSVAYVRLLHNTFGDEMDLQVVPPNYTFLTPTFPRG